jgi:hypothetical protein
MKKTLLILCIILAGMSASSQVSTLLEKGKSGIGIKGIYETSYNYYGFGGKIGGSVLGKVDVEFFYRYNVWDQAQNDLLSGDANSAYYEGRLTWWLIRKEIIPAIDVNFGVLGGFHYSNYSNYIYYDGADIITTDNWMDGQIGLTSSVNFQVAESWFLQPAFTLFCDIGNEQVSKEGVKITSSSHGITSKIGITLMKRFAKGSALYLNAEEYSETYSGYPFYQLSLGYLLPF